MQFILYTPRLYLYQFTIQDTALIKALNSKPEVLQYLHEPALSTEEEALKVIQNIILCL